jgi:transglutaminase-like putative cysteine protease
MHCEELFDKHLKNLIYCKQGISMANPFGGRPRFVGDINPDIDNPDTEYARIANWLDRFLPKEDFVTYDIKLSNSNKATYESIEVIKKLIDQGKKDIIIRTLAEKITQYLPEKDYNREAQAIYNFVTRRLRYTKDIHKVETVHRARDLLRRHRKAADCDDFVILTGSLLQAIGHPIRIVIIGNNYLDKNDYSHIYLQAYINKKWVSFDGSVPGAKMGWEAPRYATKKIINFDGSDEYVGGSLDIAKIFLWILIAYGIYFLLK